MVEKLLDGLHIQKSAAVQKIISDLDKGFLVTITPDKLPGLRPACSTENLKRQSALLISFLSLQLEAIAHNEETDLSELRQGYLAIAERNSERRGKPKDHKRRTEKPNKQTGPKQIQGVAESGARQE